MIKFFTKLSLFLLFAFAIVNLIIFVLIENLILPLNLPGAVVFNVLEKSKQKTTADKVIIGDSVGYEFLFGIDEKEFKIHNLTSNQAVAMAGNYLFFKNAVEANPGQFKEVYLLCRHTSLSNNLEQVFTWNYFVRPLIRKDTINVFSEDTMKKVKRSPFWWMIFIPVIRINPVFPPVDYFVLNKMKAEPLGLSFTTIEYLKKIKEICDKNNIKFYAVAMPVPDFYTNYKPFFEKEVKSQLKDAGLEGMLDNFLDTMSFLPMHLFRDGAHFKIDFTIEERWDLINMVLKEKTTPYAKKQKQIK